MGRWLGGLIGNEASTDPAHRKRALRGRRYAIPFDRVWAAALELIEGRRPGWTVIGADDQTGVIQAESRTRVFRFVDDVGLRIGLDEDGQTRVDLTSRSRVGKWDLGTNARRIRRFLDDLDRQLEARPRDILLVDPPPGDPTTMRRSRASGTGRG